MKKVPICQSVKELVEPVIENEHLELVDVEFKKEGKDWYLRVFIDKAQGVTVEDCQNISRQIEDMIEIDELVSSAYILEVSSPGLDRPLKSEKDFLRYQGRKVAVNTFRAIENRKHFSGIIKSCVDEELCLEEQGKFINISLDNIAKAKLEIEF